MRGGAAGTAPAISVINYWRLSRGVVEGGEGAKVVR
jgi:hypothetical protein